MSSSRTLPTDSVVASPRHVLNIIRSVNESTRISLVASDAYDISCRRGRIFRIERILGIE